MQKKSQGKPKTTINKTKPSFTITSKRALLSRTTHYMFWLQTKPSSSVSKQNTESSCNGRIFSSNFTIPAVSFAVALWGTPGQKKRNNLCHDEVPGMNKHEGMEQEQQHETDQSV
jgi:hypothetical protein